MGCEYISVSAVTAAYGFALTASPFFKRQKGTKRLCPSIRCLAVARHALTPALLRGPAAIGHPWPGAATAASLPRCPLRNACVRPLGKGQQIKIKVKSRSNGKINSFASRLAPTVGQGASIRDWSSVRTPSRAGSLLQFESAYSRCFSPLNRPSVSSPAAFDVEAPPPREAEWRFCAVGNPAWMPG
jgi:hypothetical protein